ncbi:hypothetical protein [Paractinoplanes toevensis]|uniref:Uncharacterized protein n=1 Tax=Paractinoplanes toevensis TaxID=571911 RepID=A0A919VY56_9ACTN|nr:hypothetical protein [Actinoplanes toevensis]GIM88637.1 hypothetical protein Ato02nite_004300 [Actinoplanes toevensis]
MGSSYQTVLVAGDLDAVALSAALVPVAISAVLLPVAERRWAVIPQDDAGELARLLSAACSGYAAAFEVFDSDVLSVTVFRRGTETHEYVSDQGFVVENWDDDGNEILTNLLGRSFAAGEELPTGPAGADPGAFAPLGVEPVDRAGLAAALTGPESMAEQQHHSILHALNLTPGPLQMDFEEASASDLAVIVP